MSTATATYRRRNRIYEPVQDPTSQQGFNRYAYCLYNPLRYTDPSRYVTTIPPEFKTYYYPELIGDYESYMRKWWKTRRI